MLTQGALGRTERAEWRAPALVILMALTVAVLLQQHRSLAIAVAVVPLLLLALSRPGALALLGLAALPLSFNLGRGLPVQVAITDLLFLLAVLTVLAGAATHAREDGLVALKPVLLLLAGYASALAVVIAAHPQQASLVNGLQRLQLIVVPLVIGACRLPVRTLKVGLGLYAVCALALGLAFAGDLLPASLSFQKNPVGQSVADAVLVLLGTRVGGRARLLAVPLLGLALFLGESRGALLGLIVGMLVLLLTRSGESRLRLASYLVVAGVALGAVFAVLPDDVRSRVTTVSAGTRGAAGTSGQYTIRIRQDYSREARAVIGQHPVLGVGVGQYLAGSDLNGTRTNDPHDVALLETAEGGFLLSGALLLLLVGSGVVVFRRRRASTLAPLALAVQAATVTHGLVDVYWVRGTPVLGWLLIGFVLSHSLRSTSADHADVMPQRAHITFDGERRRAARTTHHI